jgi:hypothetical protein
MMRLAAAWLCLALLACGGSSPPVVAPMPVRATTAGQGLLASAPMGADMLLELDLKRLRNNPVVGSLLASVASPNNSETVDLLRQAEVALLCVYDIGGVPKQLVILRSDEESLSGAVPLGEKLFAVGDAKLLAKAAGIQGPKESMLADLELLRLRDQVMPAEAKDAALRVSLRLDFDARVAIASKIQISDVPISVAVWGDVVDDMALIAHLGSDEVEDGPRLERAILGFRRRVAAHGFARGLGLSTPIREAQVTRVDKMVRVLVLLGPKRLQYVVNLLLKQLSNPES